jgi:hypothetical protein
MVLCYIDVGGNKIDITVRSSRVCLTLEGTGSRIYRSYNGTAFIQSTKLAANSQGDFKAMKCVKGIALGVMSLAVVILVGACGTDKSSKETTTTYVPAPAPQVVMQAPEAPPPAPPTTTTSTSSDRTSKSATSDSGAGTQDSTSSHHSESTTVTPSN